MVLLVLIVVTAFLFRFLDTELSARMELLKRGALSMLEERIGGTITYESISPSIFMFLEVRNLVIRPADNPSASLVHLSRIRIHYSLPALFLQPDPVRALREVAILNTDFDLDWERDRKIVDLIDALLFSGSSGLAAPPEVYSIQISGSNLSLTMRYENLVVEARDVFFTLGRRGEAYSLELSKAQVTATSRGSGSDPQTVRSSIRLQATISESLRWFDSQLRILSLNTRYFALQRQTFYVGYREDRVEIRKIRDKSPVDLAFGWDTTSGEMRLAFLSEDLVLSDLVSFEEEWRHLAPWLATTLTSDGELVLNPETGALSYSAHVEATLTRGAVPSDTLVRSTLRGDGERIRFDRLSLSAETGRLWFRGDILWSNLLPDGALELASVQIAPDIAVDGSLQLARSVDELSVDSSSLRVGSADFRSARIVLSPHAGSVSFRLASSLRSGRVPNSITVEGALEYASGPVLSLSSSLRDVPFDTFYALALRTDDPSSGYPFWLPEYIVDADFQLRLAPGGLDLQVASWRLSSVKMLQGDPIGEMDNPLGLLLEHSLSGNASFERAGPNSRRFSTSFTLNGHYYSLAGFQVSEGDINFYGNYGVDGFFKRRPGGFSFGVTSDRLPVPLKDPPIWVSLNLDAARGIQSEWLVASTDSSVYNLPLLASRKNELGVTCFVYGSQVSITEIAYTDEYSALSGSGDLSWPDPDALTGNVTLWSTESPESYTAALDTRDGRIDLGVAFRDSPLRRLLNINIGGTASGSLMASGPLGSPALSAAVDVDGGRWNADPFDLSARVEYENDQIELGELDLEYLDNRLRSTDGRYHIERGAFELDSQLLLDFLGSATTVDFSLRGALDPDRARGRDAVIWSGMEAVADMRNIRIGGEPSPDWSMRVQASTDTLFIGGGPEESIRGLITSEMEFELSLAEPLPVKGRVVGRLFRNILEADFSPVEIDFPLLTLLMGEDVFQFREGIAKGSLTVSGLVTDPDFYGELAAREVRVSFYMAPDSSDLFNTRLVFQEKELYFGVVRTRAGETEIASEGTIIFSHWGPASFDLAFWTTGDQGLHLTQDFGSVYADGYAQGRVRVRGDWNSTWVDGKLRIDYCKITLGEQVPYEPPEDDYATGVNLELVADKQVEFLWPSLTFPVLRTTASRGSRMLLTYDSGTPEMTIRGDVSLKGGEIFYFDRNFYFKEGLIRFNETLDRFDPRLSVRAEIRERDENNEEIRIYLIVDDERLSNFSPRFVSEPSRSEPEILALLGSPIQQQFVESGFGYSALMLSSDIVSQFGILRPFEQRVREALGLDLFSIRTRVIQNVIFDRVLGIEERSSVGEPDSPGSYFDNTTITFGKYIGNDLFLEALIRFYTETEPGLKTDFLFTLEFPTPYFNLEWTVSPTAEDLEDFILRNNTLTFSWLYSY